MTTLLTRPLAAVLFAALLTVWVPIAMAQEAVMFPARSSDLPDGSFWNMAGDHGGSNSRDLNVARRSGNSWTDQDSDGGNENTDRLIFGMPLYAPADGEIVSCWRNHPENPRPGTPHTGRCCGNNCDLSCDSNDCPSSNACTITRSGNHIAIRKNDGDIFILSHLKSGSVSSALCPNSNVFMNNARDRAGEFPAESFLRLCGAGENPGTDDCISSRPTVKRGEFVGRAGNSGASGGPHLHIHTAPVKEQNGILVRDGSIKPTNLNFGWLKHRTDSSVWKPFLADAIRNPPVLVHASPYLRRADHSAGAIGNTASLFISSNRAVTASVAASNSKIKLIVWDLVGDDQIVRRGSIEDAAAQSVHLSEPASDFVLAAIHQSDGRLRMAAFQVGPTGTLLLRAERTFGPVTSLDMATTNGPDRKAVTAFRDDDGNLKLIAWDLDFEVSTSGVQVSIERLGQEIVNPVNSVAIAPSSNFNGVFTATTDATGQLKIIPWTLSSGGDAFARGDSVSTGEIESHFDVAPLSQGVAVAARDNDGNLRVMTWSASVSGDIGEPRRGTETAGPATNITLLKSPFNSNLTTVVRGDDGDLYIIGWAAEADGRKLRRLGSSRAGPATKISAAVHMKSLLTVLRDSDGNLKLLKWETNLANP